MFAGGQGGVNGELAGGPLRQQRPQRTALKVGRDQHHRLAADAGTGQCGLQQRVGVVGKDHRVDGNLDMLAAVIGPEQPPGAQPLQAFELEAVVPHQLGRDLRSALALKVSGRRTEHRQGRGDGAGHHIAVKRCVGRNQRDVEVFHRRLQRRINVQIQHQPRIALAKRANQRRQVVHRQGRRRLHPEHAAQFLGVGQRDSFGVVDVAQDGAHPRQIGFAGLGQRELAGGALDQAGIEVPLQIGNQPGHASGRHVQRPPRRRKAAFVDDFLEHTHRQQPVHG